MPDRIQILLPGLFDLPLDELGSTFLRDRLPGLNRLLRYASPRSNRAFSIDAMLQAALGWPTGEPPAAAGLPLARAWAENPARDGDHLLLFEAIHLRPDLHSAVVIPVEKNDSELKDINSLINDLGDLFKVDCDISAVTSGVFLMRLNACAAPTHYPHILSVLGKTANPYMEQSRANLAWYRLLNEMQMFLHQHAINEHRLQQGKLPVNSLWFWGGGGQPPALQKHHGWFCDDTLLNRFAESLALRPRSLGELNENIQDGIVIDLRLLQALKSPQIEGLETLLGEIDRRILLPVLDTAARGRLAVTLRAGFDLDFELGPSAHLRFWRREKDLADWSASAQ